MQNLRTKGIVLVFMGAMFWGASSTVIQFLFQYKHLTAEWIFVIRNILAGSLFLLYAYLGKGHLLTLWHNKEDVKSLLFFCFAGLFPTQFCFIKAIEASNAATATVIQYLMPVIVLGYVLWRDKKLPDKVDNVAVVLAVLGTYFIVTKGNGNNLAISTAALLWGLASAFGMANYTVSPIRIIRKYSSPVVVGWGMLVNGTLSNFLLWPWPFQGIMDGGTLAGIVVFILFGTLLAFYFYLESTRYIPSQEVSALSSVEPLTSVVLAVTLLHVKLGVIEIIGMLCIISTVILLARKK